MRVAPSQPFLRVPPFPGAKVRSIVRPRSGPVEDLSDRAVDELVDELRRLGLGGAYWDSAPGADLWMGPASELRSRFRREVLEPYDYVDPFTNESMTVGEAIQLCGFWRALIESNRDIGCAVGFAFWKRPTAAPLLWSGRDAPAFVSRMRDIDPSRSIAVWKSRTPPTFLEELERSTLKLIEVEDGFIRSSGLGADCIPPLSIVVDRLGVHFDPKRPTDLECLIQEGPFPADLIERARLLRDLIAKSGIGKYGVAGSAVERRRGERVQILVPGQVEDDRAVTSGEGPVKTNLELLRSVRERWPDAYIIYKPHPDVDAGHRLGILDDSVALRFANEIVRDASINSLISAADEIHVISSLAGFEALLRGKAVTTYGAPFYAGWGLTSDLGLVPARRTARRSLDELVAAVLLLYPRYLDPVTGLPCPPEVLVRRLSEGAGSHRHGIVVQLRRFQGRWKKRLARVGLG